MAVVAVRTLAAHAVCDTWTRGSLWHGRSMCGWSNDFLDRKLTLVMDGGTTQSRISCSFKWKRSLKDGDWDYETRHCSCHRHGKGCKDLLQPWYRNGSLEDRTAGKLATKMEVANMHQHVGVPVHSVEHW